MKRLLLSLFSFLILAACATTAGIEPGKSMTYTFTTREPVLTGSVFITVNKDVMWCHMKAQKCVAEYHHPAVTSYMFFTKESYRLTPREPGTSYYHTDVGKTHVWDVKSEKGLQGSCGVTLTRSDTERHYAERCTLGGATITATAVVGKDELLWMFGSATSPSRGVKHFTLLSARYSP